MAFAHGITVQEQATSILSPQEASSGIPFVVGTAPVNLSTLASVPVNVPVIAYTEKEAIQALGYSDNWDSFTLSEVIYSHFRLFSMAPIIFVNVLDPDVHKKAIPAATFGLSNRSVTIPVEGILLPSIVVKSTDGTTTYVKGTDYMVAFNDAGYPVISAKMGGAIGESVTQVSVAYTKLDPDSVDADDIIGGVSQVGKVTGLELINQVFPRFGIVPDIVLAPGWSDDPTVAAVMTAKAGNINGNFKALPLTDIPTDTVANYTDAPSWKSNNGYVSSLQVVMYPKLKLGERQFHMSTQLAGVMAQTDTANGGIPFVSPSNKVLKADGAVLEDGTEVFLGPDQAQYLNSQGILTALNAGSGWRSWGNRTGAFPSSTDPKESFIAVRRMFNWIGNSLILTYMQKVDDPTNKRLIEAVTDSVNIWLNGLTASGALLGGRVEFNASENPTTDLMAGKLKFHLYITPPSPAEEIAFVLEYDTSYLAALTAA